MKHNACVMLQHGWLNRVFELAGMSYQHRLEPIARTTKKMLGYGGGCGGTTSTVENDSQEAEMGKRFIPLGGKTSEREKVLAKPLKQRKKSALRKVVRNPRGSVLRRKPLCLGHS
jgi:hypothetical protein